ncbi:MAG: ribosome maturation factor RimP [Firmicutes bacterium]|nr:ribosome maturation factor RimP [Bacillota bacterium]
MDKKITELICDLLPEDMELVELKFNRGPKLHIEVLLDNEGGISFDDLTKVNQRLGARLEELDLIPDPYILEVASAGLERPLTRPEHFVRFQGKKVKVKLIKPAKHVEGIIRAADDNQVELECKGEIIKFDYNNIKNARLVFEF